MAKEFSFDIVSKVDLAEVSNAINQAEKEIEQRFDFKGSKSEIRLEKDSLTLISDDDFKLRNVIDILESKFVKRGVPLKSLEYGKVQPAAGDTVRQEVKIVQGIDQEKGRKVTKLIKDSKIKVNASIQGDQVRVVGKDKDDLQKVIALMKQEDLGFEVQFVNYR
ncbi:MAG TPA: YajQ family cyclic di-GMP-binding protein [Verrucomicrobiae bacterium]|nr:YajQ family cyclic di-GMP-binding protein [Verrucomicrobiae bacterium]